MLIEHAAVFIRAQAGAAGEVGGPDGNRVIGAGANFSQARIGLVVGIAIDAVEVAGPAPEFLIDSRFRKTIVVCNGPLQGFRIDTDALRRTGRGSHAEVYEGRTADELVEAGS